MLPHRMHLGLLRPRRFGLGMSKAAAGIGGGFCGVPLLLATAGAGAGLAAEGGESPATTLATAAAAGFMSCMVLLNPAKQEPVGKGFSCRSVGLRLRRVPRWGRFTLALGGEVTLDAARRASGGPRDADRESAGPGQLYGGASSSRRGSWRRHVVVPGSGRGRTGEEA